MNNTNMEDAMIINEFKKIAISRFRDVMMALPALVPQTNEDKMLFKRGMASLDNLIYDLEHTENLREIGRVLDIRKILNDFDTETIRTLDSKINQSARSSIEQLTDIASRMTEEE